MINFMLDLLVDLLLFLPWSGRRRDRRKEWSGTVEAKKTLALSRHAYMIIFRTDDGQRKKVRLERKEDFDLYEKGRRYAKREGEDMPDAKVAV